MTRTQRWVAVGVVAALEAGVLAAQMHGPGSMGPHGMKLDLLATFLNLSETQKAQAKTIIESAFASASPVLAELKKGREAVVAAVKSGSPTEQQVQQLADRQSKLIGQLLAIHVKAAAKAHALLTPEQREKADKLHELIRTGLERRFPHAL